MNKQDILRCSYCGQLILPAGSELIVNGASYHDKECLQNEKRGLNVIEEEYDVNGNVIGEISRQKY